MALTSGTRLGPYEVLSALGAGGMGEVDRAHDTKLNRDVALVLELVEGQTLADRIARGSPPPVVRICAERIPGAQTLV